VGQGSTLSPILSSLYLSPFLYILENRLKNLNIPVSFLSFVDDGLIITQNKSFDISNSHLYCSYNVLSKLLDSFGLVIKRSKTEIFHFSQSQGLFNPPPLDLSPLGGPILQPKDSWKYLGFIFDRKLSFHKHIDFYANKAMSTVKCMKLLGNSLRGISPIWISTMVLHQRPDFVSHENPQQDAEKSSHLDLGSVQNFTFHGY